MPDRFSLVRWRDAKADPPPEERIVMTDLGPMGHFDGVWYDRHEWHFAEDSQPSVWCDPSPPGDDAPDISDIQFLMNAARLYAEHLAGVVKDPDIVSGMRTIFARLRRAIEEADR